MRLPVLLLLMSAGAAQAAPAFVQNFSGGTCTTIAGGSANYTLFPSESATVGNLLVVVTATDSTGAVNILDSAGNTYTAAGNVTQAITGGTVAMQVFVSRLQSAPASVTVSIASGGTNGRELCGIGEEFSGNSPAAPFVERSGFQFGDSADPLTVAISQPTATANQTLVASFARYNFPGGSGIQPYPLHAQVFSNTNAELSLDIGSGPALTAGQLYARQFDPNVPIPYLGVAVTLLPIPDNLFANGFE